VEHLDAVKSYLLPVLLAIAALALLFFAVLGPAPMPSTIGKDDNNAKDSQPPVAAGDTTSADFASSTSLPVAGPQTGANMVADSGGKVAEPKQDVLDAIDDAAYTFSPQALPFLAERLNDPDPDIREAAIDGIMQLSEPAGIEVLRKAARTAKTPQEKRRLLEAADWLALPDWRPKNVP